MATDGTFAARSARAVAELVGHDDVRVLISPTDPSMPQSPGDDEARVVLSRYVGPAVVERLQGYRIPAGVVHASWCSTGEPRFGGEFYLTDVVACLVGEVFKDGDDLLAEEERDILGDLRIIDQEPFAGSGNFTGIRVVNRHDDPEVWVYDMMKSRLHRLDLDYGTYMDTALRIKGAFGWQYLFADVDLGSIAFHNEEGNLRQALARLPSMFPGYSYTDLAERLEERL